MFVMQWIDRRLFSAGPRVLAILIFWLASILHCLPANALDQPALTVTLSQKSVTGGDPIVGSVQFSPPLPPGQGPVAFKLYSSDMGVQYDFGGHQLVLTGGSSVPFTLTTQAVTKLTAVVITAEAGQWSGSALLAVNPHDTPRSLLTISLAPSSVVGGQTVTGTLQFAPPLPAWLPKVLPTLSRSDQSVSIDASALTNGLTTGASLPFTVKTSAVDAPHAVAITASAPNFASASALLTITPPALGGIVTSANTGSSANNITGVVQLTGPAPTDTQVTIQSSNADVIVPSTPIVVPKGSDISPPFAIACSKSETISSTVLSAQVNIAGVESSKTAPLSFAAKAETVVTVPAGQRIYVTSPSAAIRSLSVSKGDRIVFTVANDVYYPNKGYTLNRVIVIPRGNPVICHVVKSKRPGSLFDPGQLTVEIDAVEAADGKFIPVTIDPRVYDFNLLTSKHVTFTAVDDQGRRITQEGLDQLIQESNYVVTEPDSGAPESFDNAFLTKDTHAVVYGVTDQRQIPLAALTLGAAYGVGTVNVSNTTHVDAYAIGPFASSSAFPTLFTGVPCILPAGVTYAVQTTTKTKVSVKNPLAGQ